MNKGHNKNNDKKTAMASILPRLWMLWCWSLSATAVSSIGGAHAFVTSNDGHRRQSLASQSFLSPPSALFVFNKNKSSTSKPNKANKPIPSTKKKESIQVTDPVQLVILYMTPWRNPNSIFVYLFGILYVLGKVSEARSAAGH